MRAALRILINIVLLCGIYFYKRVQLVKTLLWLLYEMQVYNEIMLCCRHGMV